MAMFGRIGAARLGSRQSKRLAEHNRLQSALDVDGAAKNAVEIPGEADALQQLRDEHGGDEEQASAKVELGSVLLQLF